MYLSIKAIHMSAACLSVLGFIVRGILLSRGIDYRSHRLTHALPHIVDTVLLISGLTLAWMSLQYPWQQAWLGTKLLLLLAYIVLGTWAFKWAKTGAQRHLAMTLAITTFGYMLLIASTRSVLPLMQ